MGSVEASKGGATGYELGTGLGITLFGVFMSGAFGRAIVLPAGLPEPLSEQATRSIGDTYLVAGMPQAEQATAVVEAGKAAFSQTHTVLLMTAASIITALAVCQDAAQHSARLTVTRTLCSFPIKR